MDLTSTRIAVEALSTALEVMEHDCKLVAEQFTTTSKSSDAFTSVLLQQSAESQKDTTQNKRIILASSSKWRRAIVASIIPDGFEMCDEFISPDIDEKAIRRDDPQDMVLAIANAKADKAIEIIQNRYREADKPDMIICADQIVMFRDEVREKPESRKQAKEHLQSYGLHKVPAKCVTGVVVVSGLNYENRHEGVDVAKQYFESIPDEICQVLLEKGDILHCAGSFVVEDPLLEPYLASREGEIASVQGMPGSLTRRLLIQARELLEVPTNKNKKTRM